MRQRRLQSAAEMATEEVRELIHSGYLKPGQRINPDDLAQHLMISRTPIRDALQGLKTEGLVEILPRVGVFVRHISQNEVRDVYAIKTALEPLTAGWAAARGSVDAKQELATMMERLRELGGNGDVRACADCVDAIHTKLFEMSGSDVLLDVYRVIGGRVKLLRNLNMAQPGRLEVSTEQHHAIVRAVTDGDADRATRAMRRHMLDAAKSVRNVLSTLAAPQADADGQARQQAG